MRRLMKDIFSIGISCSYTAKTEGILSVCKTLPHFFGRGLLFIGRLLHIKKIEPRRR